MLNQQPTWPAAGLCACRPYPILTGTVFNPKGEDGYSFYPLEVGPYCQWPQHCSIAMQELVRLCSAIGTSGPLHRVQLWY